MDFNKELLVYLTQELLEDARKEPWLEDISQSVGNLKLHGIAYQLQLTLTRNEDDFMDGILGDDVFEVQPTINRFNE